MPLGTNQATNYLANNPDLVQYYKENIAGTPEEANYVGQGGNQSAFLGFASAHYDMAGEVEIAENKRPAGSLNPTVALIAGTTGADTAGGPPGGTTTFNLADIPPPDLTPVTSAIGTPTTAQTAADQTTLMGQTAGLATGQAGIMSGQQGIRDVVDPLGTQVTDIGTQIGTADIDAGQTDLFAGQRGIMSGIGTAGTETTPGTGLLGGQAGIQAGIGTAVGDQTDLFAGQAGLATGQAGIQTGIGTAATDTAQGTGLLGGQERLGTQIGTPSVRDFDTGEMTDPTGLYEGQAGIMSGQAGLTSGQAGLGTQLSGIGTDLSADIQAEASRLGGQIGDFRTAAEQYQRGATTQRGDIQGTQRAGQANLVQQIQGVGQGINRQAEALARQRQEEASQFQEATQPLQQAVSQFAQNAPAASVNQQVGPMGPMARDPRDALIQNLLRNAALMNRRPV